MGSHVLEILRQGLWASLTGGWFYDPRHGIFCNTFHLYLWLFLLCFPLTLYLTLPSIWLIWGAYSVVIFLLFLVLKIVNHNLHHMFDSSEVVEEEGTEDGAVSADEDRSRNSDTAASKSHTTGETKDGIELTVIGSNSQRPSVTPPVQCSSRASMVESASRGSVRRTITPTSSRASMVFERRVTPVDSMEYINRLIKEKDEPRRTKDYKVDVHWAETEPPVLAMTTFGRDVDTMGRPNLKDHVQTGSPGPPRLADSFDQDPVDGSTCLTVCIQRPDESQEEQEQPSFLTCLSSSTVAPDQETRSFTEGCSFTEDPALLSSEAVHCSPNRIKSRRHRKAVRRTRSAVDDVHPKRLHSIYIDPREPQSLEHQVPPTCGNISKARPRQYSLPEPRDMDTTGQHIGGIQFPKPEKTHNVKEENSSLSSYKETSPESEYLPKSRWDRHPRLSEADCRTRVVTPSVKSLDVLKFDSPHHHRSHSTGPSHVHPKMSDRPRSRSLVEDLKCVSPLRSSQRSGHSVASTVTNSSCGSHSSVPSSHKSIVTDNFDSSDDEDENDERLFQAAKPVMLPRLSYLEEKSESSQTLTDHKSKSTDCVGPHKKSYSHDNMSAAKLKPPLKHKKLFRLSALVKGGSRDGQDNTTNGDSVKSARSQQSSTVGLDWLFSTDTDSASSDESSSRSDLSDSPSTLTNDEATSSPERHPHMGRLFDAPTAGPSSSYDPMQGRFPSLSSSSTSPDPDSLSGRGQSGSSLCRHRGTGVRHREQATNTSRGPQSDSDTDGSVDLSVDLADTVELSKRLLDIINLADPHEAEEELKKLKDELNARKERQENISEKGTPNKNDKEPSRRSRSRVAHKGTKSHSKSRAPQEVAPEPSCSHEQEKNSSSRESSASNHNEGSALLSDKRMLPESSSHQGENSLDNENRNRVKHGSGRSFKRNASVLSEGGSPPSAVENMVKSSSSKHMAMSHDDTTEGAVHCFQDETGHWYIYSFCENSVGMAEGIDIQAATSKDKSKDGADSSSVSSFPIPYRWESEVHKPRRSKSSRDYRDSLDLTHVAYLPAEDPDPMANYMANIRTMDRYRSGQSGGPGRQRSETSSTDLTTTRDTSSSGDKPKFFYKYFVIPKKKKVPTATLR